MSAVFHRRLSIPGASNIRDLGGYPTRDGETQWRRILRGDGLHRLGPEGVQALHDAGVRTVIDLRHAGELAAQPNPLRFQRDVLYLNIPLFDQLAPARASEGPARKIDILLDLYLLALASRQSAIREVLTAISDADEGAVLFHCTAGKDRTGIIAALILGITGADRSTILDDYALTAVMIAPMIDEIVAGARARGLDVEQFMPLLACEAGTMQATLEHLDEQYGGLASYLNLIGVDSPAKDRIHHRLIGVATQRMAP